MNIFLSNSVVFRPIGSNQTKFNHSISTRILRNEIMLNNLSHVSEYVPNGDLKDRNVKCSMELGYYRAVLLMFVVQCLIVPPNTAWVEFGADVLSSEYKTAAAAQLLSLHAVLSSVRLTFSSKDALVHILMLSMYCILGRPLILFPDIIPRMQVFTRLHLLFLHACPKKAIFLLIIWARRSRLV